MKPQLFPIFGYVDGTPTLAKIQISYSNITDFWGKSILAKCLQYQYLGKPKIITDTMVDIANQPKFCLCWRSQVKDIVTGAGYERSVFKKVMHQFCH